VSTHRLKRLRRWRVQRLGFDLADHGNGALRAGPPRQDEPI